MSKFGTTIKIIAAVVVLIILLAAGISYWMYLLMTDSAWGGG